MGVLESMIILNCVFRLSWTDLLGVLVAEAETVSLFERESSMTGRRIMANKTVLSTNRYWEYVLLLILLLLALHAFLRPTPTSAYTLIIGHLGLAIEAILPLPQILANHRARSCKGFRLSVLANWLVGDAMKMLFFFASDGDKVPWPFKLCGIFQACCDAGLGFQYWLYGDGKREERSSGEARGWLETNNP